MKKEFTSAKSITIESLSIPSSHRTGRIPNDSFHRSLLAARKVEANRHRQVPFFHSRDSKSAVQVHSEEGQLEMDSSHRASHVIVF